MMMEARKEMILFPVETVSERNSTSRAARFMPWVIMVQILVVLVSLSGCKDIVFNNPLDPNGSKDVLNVIRVIETSLGGVGDIAYDGEKFWKISPGGALIAFDRESGVVIRTFGVEPGTGVAFYDETIYLCHNEQDNMLVLVDPLAGDILNRITTGQLFPGYITASGNRLLLYDARSSGIFRYHPETGDSNRLFEVSGFEVGGIASYKNGILITDMNTDSIYRFSLDGEVEDVFTSPASGVSGIAVDGSNNVYLFMIDGKIYKVSLP
jgi:outer membrane protein assembly factor BamB